MKTILITGGNSGIGYATAKQCKAKGYEVTITGRDQSRVGKAAEELGVVGIVADMARLDDVQRVVDNFREQGLDSLVNNAAHAKFLPIESHTQADYDDFFNTNIRGPLMLIQGLLPALEKNKGSISNISSAVSNNGLTNASLYAASKGAMDAFTHSLAIELAPKGIRINAIAPGAVDTPIINKLGIPAEHIPAVKAQIESNIPMGRFGKAEEIAQIIIAQLEATYVTGAVWEVDGGINSI